MAGEFIWYELIVPDADAAARFYGEVIGWQARDSGQEGIDYRLLSIGGADVAGLMATPADAQGMPPAWFGYVAVDDVDRTAATVANDGGTVHMPPTDIPGIGRFAMVADPQGASLYLMTPSGEGESRSFAPDRLGHCAWNELHARDWRAVWPFYAERFGWQQDEAMESPMGTYQMFRPGSGGPVGAMLTDKDRPQPAWLFYFQIDEIDAAKARLERAGGTALGDPHEIPGGDFILHAHDPQGAAFALVGPRRG